MFMIDGITWQKQGPGIYFGRKKVAQNEKKNPVRRFSYSNIMADLESFQ